MLHSVSPRRTMCLSDLFRGARASIEAVADCVLMPVGAAVISRSCPGRINVPRILFAVLIAAIDTPYLSAMPPSVSPFLTW